MSVNVKRDCVWFVLETEEGKLHLSTGQHTVEGSAGLADEEVAPVKRKKRRRRRRERRRRRKTHQTPEHCVSSVEDKDRKK